MRRAFLFAGRCMKEILRDPLSYVFSLALPVILLVVMNAVFYDPVGAFWFSLDMMVPGITVFSFAFTMLFMAMLVAKDRCTAFLTRLRSSPMTTPDFVLGYALPGILVGVVQTLVCCAAAAVLSLATGQSLNIARLALMLLCQLPILLMYVGAGILFGTLFSDKAAPGACSAVISVGGFLCGAWLPVEMYARSAKGFYQVCRLLPFWPSTVSGRLALGLSADTQAAMAAIGGGYGQGDFLYGLLLGLGYAVVIFIVSIVALRGKLRRDI